MGSKQPGVTVLDAGVQAPAECMVA